jgi:glyoxylase-like metal-dependent hydrolase (beta-lactamase superfamily II)
MFGVVPRTLWESKAPPDERNRIAMAMNVALIRAGGTNVLVDTGAGDKEDGKFRDLYGLGEPTLLDGLREAGLEAADIHVVVNTHLHFDHAGGNTVLDGDGRPRPAFPNARYLVQRREFEDAMAPDERSRASYFKHNYGPLYEEGRLELLDGEAEIAPGVRALPLPGHTPGMQGVLVESGGQTAIHFGDCVPTSHHVALPWIMAFDLFPLTTLDTKKRILPLAAREGWVAFFEHDPSAPAGRIEETAPHRFRAAPLEP